MTDRPLEITEMGIRVLFQAIWFGALAALLIWWSWPTWLWAFAGFPESAMPQGWTLVGHAFAALFGTAWALQTAGLVFFQLLPFVIARLLQPGPPKLPRRN